MAVADLGASELQALLDEHGSYAAVAAHLNASPSTVRDACNRHGIGRTPSAARGLRGNLTREALAVAMLPPNNCAVKAFLDQLSDEQREIVEYGLSIDRKDLPARLLRDELVKAGYPEAQVPGVDAINNHRSGTRPCRCKG